MAIVFELVADFLRQDHAEECCQWMNDRITNVPIDSFDIAIHPAFVSPIPYGNPTHFQVSVVPAQVGCAVALDEHDYTHALNRDQLSRLGMALYEWLRGAPHYQLAGVGWDVDGFLDMEELRVDGLFPGLVVAKHLLNQLPTASELQAFDQDHIWLPYTGSDTLWP